MYRGRWANPDDSDMFAAMRRIYRDPDEAHQIGTRAAARAAGFTWDDTVNRLSGVLIRRGLLG
jgi:hypothetical protein